MLSAFGVEHGQEVRKAFGFRKMGGGLKKLGGLGAGASAGKTAAVPGKIKKPKSPQPPSW